MNSLFYYLNTAKRNFTHSCFYNQETLCVVLYFLGILTWMLILFPRLLTLFPILILLIFTSLLIAQSLMTIRWMLNIWSHPNKLKNKFAKKDWQKPHYSFSAIVPARHETKVLKKTISSIIRINYPKKLKEIIIVCSEDDKETIATAIHIRNKYSLKNNIKLVIYADNPINKPHALNIALKKAKNNIITVFDAEDEPSKDIYKIINTVLLTKKVDVVQSGIQLMNINSHWFSIPNILEYYFWFKSALPFFYNHKLTLLGGNTVFIKKSILTKLKGWDQNKLTEDADLGVKLTLNNIKTYSIYNAKHVTQEETPVNIKSFIKQRTRWNHGFIQILNEGKWLKLPTLKQKTLSLYIFSSPLIHCLWFIYFPLGLWLKKYDLPIPISMFSFLPLNFLFIQIWIYFLGLIEFIKDYNLKFTWKLFLKLVIIIFPYQILLAIAGLRALYRFITNKNNWEKTQHENQHRQIDYQFS